MQKVLRWLLALLLIWAALSKLRDVSSFLATLYAYDLPMPRTLLKVVAIALPFVELFCGIMLLIDLWSETALVVTLAMMVVFLAATGQAWARDLQISCGCFDLKMLGIKLSSSTAKFLESAHFAFFRNIALTAITGFLFAKTWSKIRRSDAQAKG